MEIYQKPEVEKFIDSIAFSLHKIQQKVKVILKFTTQKTLLSNINYFLGYIFDIFYIEISVFKAQRDR